MKEDPLGYSNIKNQSCTLFKELQETKQMEVNGFHCLNEPSPIKIVVK